MKKNYLPWIIGLGAAGVVAYLYKDDLKKLFKRKDEKDSDENNDQELPPPAFVDQSQQLPKELTVTNTGIEMQPVTITPGFNVLGTPKTKLNFSQIFKYGDKGQEIAKMQQILNRISDITGKSKVKEDGIYGQGTETRLSQMFGNTDNLNLYKIYAALYAINQANEKKQLKNWFTAYQGNLNDQLFFNISKKIYLEKNKEI